MPSAATRHRTTPTRHTLLLLALTGAATITALALADQAHASDHPAPVVDGVTRLLGDTTHTLTGDSDTRPVRDLTRRTLTHPTQAVDTTVKTTTRRTKQLTDRLDDTTAKLPAAGRAIDKTTDLTDAILDTTPAPSAPKPPPPATPPPATTPTPARQPAPQATAPTTRVRATPTPGATHHRSPTAEAAPGTPQHPAVGHHTPATPPTEPNPPAAVDLHPAHTPTNSDWSLDSSRHDTRTSSTPQPDPALTTVGWQPPPRWQQHVIDYTHQHTSRTRAPSPPSG